MSESLSYYLDLSARLGNMTGKVGEVVLEVGHQGLHLMGWMAED